jgi:hypothetical protein
MNPEDEQAIRQAIEAGFRKLCEDTERGMARDSARFDRIDAAFDCIEPRFDRIEAKFDGIEAKLDRIQDMLDRTLEKVRAMNAMAQDFERNSAEPQSRRGD